MAVFKNHFYHKTISLLTGVFGSIFDDLKIIRSNGTEIRVPIAYASKRKYNVRNDQNPDPNAVRYKMQLPRMSFKLVGLRRDSTRSLNKMHKLLDTVDRTQVTQMNSQLNRVPFVFNYELSLKTKTIDDMLQLIEQVMVYFNPSLNVIVKDNPDIDQSSAIVVRLLETGIEDISEGTFDGEELIETNMQFELEGWLYMPTHTSKVITRVIVNTFDMNSNELLESITEVP